MSEDTTLDEFTKSESQSDESNKNQLARKTVCGIPPKDWSVARLGEVVDVVSGNSLPNEYQDDSGGEHPIYKVSDMNESGNEKYVTTSVNWLNENELEELNHTLYPKQTTILPKVGAALLTNKRRLLTEPSSFDNNVMGWVPDEINPEFMYYVSCMIDMEAVAQKGAVPSISKAIAKSLKIPLPASEEQHKIATVLHNVDQAIQKTEELVNQTKRVKQGATQDLLKSGIDNERTVETDSRFGQLPESWELRPLKEVGDIAGRTAPEKDDSECWGGNIPWATPSEITSLEGPTINETEEHLTELALDKVSSNLLPPKSVLLTTRATIGACAVNTVELTTNQGFKNLIPGESIDTWYAYYRLDYEGDYLASLSKGSTFPEVGKDTVENFVIPVPPLEEQREIGERLRSVHDQVLSYKENISQLKRLKKGLMQDLLSGTVRTADTIIEVPNEIAQHG